MAYPTILMDSTNGSDSNASGAGPTTAITSTSASTSADGLTVTIPNADLTNVVTDGSHAVYISGEGLRSITGKADSGLSTANVTVGTAFSFSLTGQTAAIGGVRQYLFGSTKSEIESSLEAGWTVQFAAGHSESYNGSYFSFNVGDTRTNPITLQGDENSRATFISVYNGFVIHFSFASSSGLNVKNCNFEGYRGTDTSGTGDIRHVVYAGRQSVFVNCKTTSRRHYSGNASWYDTAASTFVNCESIITSDSAYKYTVGGGAGWGGRGSSLINCKVYGRYYGVAQQSWEAVTPYIVGCHFDCYIGVRFGGTGIYHLGHTLSGNVFKIQDGGTGIDLSIDAWSYGLSGYKMIHSKNIFTSDGQYSGIVISKPQTTASNLYNNTWYIDNVFHNSAAPSSVVPEGQIINSIDDDPQLDGDLTDGFFSVGNRTVLDHVAIAPLVSPTFTSGSTAGTQIYPFRQFVSDKFGAVLHPLRSN